MLRISNSYFSHGQTRRNTDWPNFRTLLSKMPYSSYTSFKFTGSNTTKFLKRINEIVCTFKTKYLCNFLNR
jgi:hypothetical protein